MKGRLLVFVVMASLLLTACSSSKRASQDLAGTWENKCADVGKIGLTSLSYNVPNVTGAFTTYADATCKTATTVTTWTGTITGGGETAAAGVRTLDLTYSGFKAKALTQEGADLFNRDAYCGATDWAPGVEKDILNKNCYGFMLHKGDRSLDIYKVEGNTVIFGKGAKTAQKLAESDRTTELDASMRVFTRK